MLNYERKQDQIIPFHKFLHRLIGCLGLAAVLMSVALGVGVLGYHFIAGFAWIDSVLEAAMILTGMGPVGPLSSAGAKLFAAAYALFSGLVFVTVMGITLSPIFHRVLHGFHLDDEDFRNDA